MWLPIPPAEREVLWEGRMLPESPDETERLVNDEVARLLRPSRPAADDEERSGGAVSRTPAGEGDRSSPSLVRTPGATADRERWSEDEFYENARQVLKELPAASIGQPEVWELSELYPQGQIPPAIRVKMDEADFYLVRGTCSLRPEGGFKVTRAVFQIGLAPDDDGRQPHAFDLYPLETVRETARTKKVTLDPSLKFKEIEASVGSLEFGFEYPELEPEVSAFGVGESQPSWEYRRTRGTTVQGSKLAYLLIAAPKGMPKGKAALGLTADVERGGFGLPVKWFRDTDRNQAGFTVTLWG